MKYFAMTNEKSVSNLHFKATYGRSLVYITRITQKCIKKPTTTRYRFFFFYILTSKIFAMSSYTFINFCNFGYFVCH